MSNQIGTIGWLDLTVSNADQMRDFYAAVAGWTPQPVSMGEYNDYNMTAASGQAVAGVCHARGGNAGIPPQWIMYVTVADIDNRIQAALDQGGEIVHRTNNDAGATIMAFVRDPAGAVFGLYQA